MLIKLATADLSVTGWLGTVSVMILYIVLSAVREITRKNTVTAMIESAEPGTCVLDRRRSRTILVVKAAAAPPAVAVVLVGRRPS